MRRFDIYKGILVIKLVSFNSKSISSILSILLLPSLLVSGLLLSGCTVIGTNTSIAQSQSIPLNEQEENTPLTKAAEELAATPWPQPQKITLPDRMAGIVLGNEKEKIISVDPVKAYVDKLNRRANNVRNNFPQNNSDKLKTQRLTLLQEDAATHLLTANKVTDAVYASLSSDNLSAVDINIAETAISDLRTARNIYIKTLKKLADDGEDIKSIEISQLKNQFMDVSRKLGRATDDLADKLNDNHPKSSKFISNFIRSR